MPHRRYSVTLSSDDKLIVRLTTEKGNLKYFVIQYIAYIGGERHTVIRVDTAHGHAHQHTYYLHKKEYRVSLNQQDYSILFNKMLAYIKHNYQAIKESFLQER